MTNPTQIEPGSPQPLTDFHAWFRGGAISRASRGEVPAALAANDPRRKEPLVTEYQMTGTPPPVGELVGQLVVNWINESEASQIGLSLPFGHDGDRYHLFLLSIDETGYIAEHAVVGVDGQILHIEEMSPDSPWPFAEWQGMLARNAGYEAPIGGDHKDASLELGTERKKPSLARLTDTSPASPGERRHGYRQDPPEPQQRSGLEPEG
jgi:hypothetical protein